MSEVALVPPMRASADELERSVTLEVALSGLRVSALTLPPAKTMHAPPRPRPPFPVVLLMSLAQPGPPEHVPPRRGIAQARHALPD